MKCTAEVTRVPESPMVKIATAAEAMPGSIKLCYGESDLPTPDFICRAADAAMRTGHTFYTHTAGSPEFREAVAAKIHALHGVEYRPSEVMGTVGATCAIFTATRTLVGPGDNAVILTPTYAIFSNAVTLCGGEPREVPLVRVGERFALDLDRVRAAIDANTRAIVVNSPSNPTGWVISEHEQRALCELAERHDLVIVADEVYERLIYSALDAKRAVAPSFARVMTDKSRLIVINSFSKTYNMTGWRLGWAQSSEARIRAMYKAAEFITSNPSSMVQQAGIVALRDGESAIADLAAHYRARRDQVVTALRALPDARVAASDGAFYAFFKVDGVTDDSTAFTARLLRETGLALAPGAAFGYGGEGYVRLCFAASERVVAEALGRLTRAVNPDEPRPRNLNR